MSLTISDVDHIAELARLTIEEKEKESVRGQLEAILAHVSRIQAVDTSKISETMRVGEEVNQWREDLRKNSLDADLALANAPDSDGHFFKVESIHEGA